MVGRRRIPLGGSVLIRPCHFGRKIEAFKSGHCRESQGFCQVKKELIPLERIEARRKPSGFIALRRIPVQKWRCQDARAFSPFTRNLPSVGLSERIDPPKGIRRPTAMHKILLAEDDNDMRRFLVKALENAGFQVSSHDNGMSAYQRLREEPFEMLLTDIVMPEMDGIELARRASELDPDIKIMFITGFAAVALNSDSEAPKNAKVLSKPVHLRELVSEVNKMLAA
jgi:two-component system cell cycle response regulator CpdR